jgi:copper chaperone CopZ
VARSASVSSCKSRGSESPGAGVALAGLAADRSVRVELGVSGMTCAACSARVARAISKVHAGISDVSVNCVTDAASFSVPRSAADRVAAAAVDAIKATGYGAELTAVVDDQAAALLAAVAADEPEFASFTTSGMICSSCPPRIARGLRARAGVEDVVVTCVLGPAPPAPAYGDPPPGGAPRGTFRARVAASEPFGAGSCWTASRCGTTRPPWARASSGGSSRGSGTR